MTSFVKPTEAYRQGQRTLLREYYTAPEIYGEEMERIFCRRWLCAGRAAELADPGDFVVRTVADRKSTRLNSSHGSISYAVFCLKKKNRTEDEHLVHLG